LSLNSLVYGSDTQGILFKNDNMQAENLAKEIGLLLNLKPYIFKERASGVMKEAYLPFGVQIHETEQDGFYTLVNAFKLIPTEGPTIKRINKSTKLIDQDLYNYLSLIESFGKPLRTEMSVYNH
jgi:hypothetical protein